MKKQTFNQRVSKINTEAIAFIESLFAGKKRVIRLCDKDAEEIYDMPDFAYYSKHGFVDWCNIFEIRKVKYKYTDFAGEKKATNEIQISGVCKESGLVESVFLHEIDEIHIITLASYFQD